MSRDDTLLDSDRKLVLVKCEDFCVLLTRYSFQLLLNYEYAIKNAQTWADFKAIIGSKYFSQFFEDFLLNDEYKPDGDDILSDIEGDVWVLFDSEFPATQCLDITTSLVGDFVPACYLKYRFTTEYGQLIDVYNLEEAVNIVNVLKAQGMFVDVCNLPFRLDLSGCLAIKF